MSDKVFSDATGARLKELEQQARAEMALISEARDRLRGIVREFEGVIDSCDEGLDDMKTGLDTISRFV